MSQLQSEEEKPEPVITQERLRRALTDESLPNPAPGGYVRYEAFEDFREGGGGILKLAEDAYLNRRVVVKKLRPELMDKDDVRQRFLREARVTALIQHPATVPIYELGRDEEGIPYFSMKPLQGDSLQDILKGIVAHERKYDHFRLREALMDIVTQVGQALAFAHASGVVHRDIKPANIQVGGFGEVMVMDWGVAKIMEPLSDTEHGELPQEVFPSLTVHGKVYGTPRYMAPEQAKGNEDIDYRVDVFSLGAVLYECLTFRPLVFGASRDELLKKIVEEPFVSPSKREPLRMIPPELDAIVMKALEKDPAERYQTMDHFLDDLQSFRRGESPSVAHATIRGRIQRWQRTYFPLKRSVGLLALGAFLGYLVRGLAG